MKEKMIEGGFAEDKIHHVPTFVDLDRFKPNKEKRRQIISYTGRIHPTKGIDVLIDAFRIIQAKVEHKNVKLMIAGDDKTADARRLKSYIDKNDIKNIKLTGPLHEEGVRQLLSSSLVSVVPSLCYENMPNTALESLACGTPVIASNLGSFPEVLGGDGTGVLFTVGDAEDLADKIIFILSDRQRLRVMSNKARKIAEHQYNADLHYGRLMNVFNALL